jgi:hypothetical protein
MFQTVFSPSRDETLRLLDYSRYLWAEGIAEKVASHPLFAPSPLWRRWAGQSFLGFSLEKLILQGGHAFASAIEVPAADEPTGRLATVRRGVRDLLGSSARARMRAGREPGFLSEAFNRFYPDAGVCSEHTGWFARHPNPYFRCLEAYLLREKAELPTNMLEVGAGACVNVAFYHSLNRRMKSIVIDLPETIFFGYAMLRTVLPDLQILLPHEISNSASAFDADVVFLLPTQADTIPDDSVDFCFNMSSFQEMSIATVNNYLRFLGRKLIYGGRLVSVNFEVSRYLEGNALKNYDLAGYHSSATTRVAPFATDLIGHICGLTVMHLEIEKRRPT